MFGHLVRLFFRSRLCASVVFFRAAFFCSHIPLPLLLALGSSFVLLGRWRSFPLLRFDSCLPCLSRLRLSSFYLFFQAEFPSFSPGFFLPTFPPLSSWLSRLRSTVPSLEANVAFFGGSYQSLPVKFFVELTFFFTVRSLQMAHTSSFDLVRSDTFLLLVTLQFLFLAVVFFSPSSPQVVLVNLCLLGFSSF